MVKAVSKDSQIILNMMRVQDKMSDILESKKEKKDLYKDASSIDLLTFYITKMFAMRKNFSGKTKKALTFFNEKRGAMVQSSLGYCYPMLSPQSIVDLATSMSDDNAYGELQKRYEVCIKESVKYEGDE